MQNKDLSKIVSYLVDNGVKLIKKHTSETNLPVEFACIFCQNNKEYDELTKTISGLGKTVQDTSTGYTYQLNKPIKTVAGELKLVKIRKPDPVRKERGDTDFNTNYPEFKEKYQNKTGFEFVKRDNHEMLRLSDPSFDVMVCFSNIPFVKTLNLKKFLTQFTSPY